jgi:hypothetical protein
MAEDSQKNRLQEYVFRQLFFLKREIGVKMHLFGIT